MGTEALPTPIITLQLLDKIPTNLSKHNNKNKNKSCYHRLEYLCRWLEMRGCNLVIGEEPAKLLTSLTSSQLSTGYRHIEPTISKTHKQSCFQFWI